MGKLLMRHLALEDFKIEHEENLQQVRDWSEAGGKVGCIAVRIGMVRLIDNINISS